LIKFYFRLHVHMKRLIEPLYKQTKQWLLAHVQENVCLLIQVYMWLQAHLKIMGRVRLRA